jgi:hypothetical protein
MPTPPRTFSIGFKWIFVQKNENNEVVRYKVRLVAQSFTQRPRVDFNKTYSPVMNGITFRYLISLAIQKHLSLQLMDVYECKSQHVLCKTCQVLIWLETIGKNVIQPTEGIPPKQRILE